MNNLFNLKSFLKFLSRNKTYTAIDIFGLSVSLMFVLLIAVYTVQELSTDRFQEKAERIYLVGCEDAPYTGAAIPYMLKERYPEIEKVCPMVMQQQQNIPVQTESLKLNADLMFADTTFFSIFSFRLLQGNPSDALVASNNVVVSQSFARKLFGSGEVLGKTVTVGDSLHLTVSGVVEDLKHSAIPEADLILPWRQITYFNSSLAPDQMGNAGGTTCCVLVHEGSDLKAKADDMKAWLSGFFWPYERGIWKEVRMEKLSDYYFSGWGGWPLRVGDRRFVLVLMSVGILILVFAILNYINLSVAQAGFRAKEMATRRLLGSTRGELFWRLMCESVFLCFIALGGALLLAFSVLPYANELLQAKLDLPVVFTPGWLMVIAGFVVLVGGLSGWLPAVVISSAKPIDIVRGSFRAQTKMVFSKLFITFQNFITIVMLACSLVMILQIKHLIEAPVGYNSKNLYYISAIGLDTAERQQAFCDRLRRIGGVARVGRTQGLPLLGSNNYTTYFDDGGIQRNISFQQYPMDRECFEILGLQMLSDNQLADPYWYLNEEALRQMNLPQDATSFAIGRHDAGIVNFTLAGVISDFHEGNITQRIAPVMFRFLKSDEGAWWFLVELQGNPYETVKEMKAVYSDMTGGLEMSGNFYDRELQSSFDSQIRLAKIVGVFTAIAVLISLLGLLAMSTYFIQQRSMEVAVRKVFGSTERQVLRKLVGTFLRYVLIAFVLAVPVAYYVGAEWLSDYDYRITLHPWIFLLAGLFCFLVSFLAVFGQSWRAANTNPIRHLGKRE